MHKQHLDGLLLDIPLEDNIEYYDHGAKTNLKQWLIGIYDQYKTQKNDGLKHFSMFNSGVMTGPHKNNGKNLYFIAYKEKFGSKKRSAVAVLKTRAHEETHFLDHSGNLKYLLNDMLSNGDIQSCVKICIAYMCGQDEQIAHVGGSYAIRKRKM
jgi:hypothetical protein